MSFEVKGSCGYCCGSVLISLPTVKSTLSALLKAAGQGCSSLHTIPIEGRDVRDDPIDSEAALQAALISMVPVLEPVPVEGTLSSASWRLSQRVLPPHAHLPLIRSSAQTLCDDLARAAEAKDGKKKPPHAHLPP